MNFNKTKYQGFNAVKMTVGRDGSENCEDRIEFIRKEETPDLSEHRNVTPVNTRARKNTGTTINETMKMRNETAENHVCQKKAQYFEMKIFWK